MCIAPKVIPKQDICINGPSTASMARITPSSWQMYCINARQVTVESALMLEII